MKEKDKSTYIFSALMVIGLIILGLGYSEFSNAGELTADGPVVAELVAEPPTTEILQVSVSHPSGQDCHVSIPKGTTVSTLKSIGIALENAGCNVTDWWSTLPDLWADDAVVAK